MRTLKRCVGSIIAIALGCVAGSAQVDSKTSDRVSVPLIAEDGRGNILSITAGDLTVTEDKNRPVRDLTLQSAKDLPLQLAVLVDASKSESQNDLYKPGLHELSELVKTLVTNEQDRVMFVTFATTADETTWLGKNDLQTFRINLGRGGGTALYDAIQLTADRMHVDIEKPCRRAIVIFSDGEDNQSRITRAQASEAAQAVGAMIFAISTNRIGMQLRGDKVLDGFARQTGGTFSFGGDPRNLTKRFAMIRAEIDGMYLASYVPADSDRKPHFISAKLTTADKKAKIRAPERRFPN